MGIVVRSPNGTVVSASQRPRTVLRPGRRPIVLTRSPRGPIRTGTRYPRSPYAGRFDVLDANGFAERAGVRFRSEYRFASDHIHLGWRVTRGRTDALSAEAVFPSWEETAKVNAVLADRTMQLTRVPGGSTQVEVAAVRYFFIEGGEGGYVILVRAFPPGAVARLIFPVSQSSNPRPGPSLSLRLAPVSRWHDLALRVVLAPARTAEEAAAVIPRL
jgi:hypothetical protein